MCPADCSAHTHHDEPPENDEDLNLHETMLKLRLVIPVSPSLIKAVAKHATSLSDNIQEKFLELQTILKAHEATIRKRWFEMTADERRQILMTAWPNMPETHRPDYAEENQFFKEGNTTCARVGYPSDAKIWPYINMEDLMRPVCLLIFLNTRGRNLPFNLSTTETHFCPLTNVERWGKRQYILSFLMHFSDRGTQPCDRLCMWLLDELDEDKKGFKSSLYPGLLALQIQQRVMSFLVECSRMILYDMSESTLLHSTTQIEPPASELDIQSECGHAKYEDSLMIAPYRNRGTVEFSRLRGYFSALYTVSRDHLLALREDPSYFADTFQDIWEHTLEQIPDAKGRTHPGADTKEFRASKAKDVVGEAYRMFSIWRELYLISEKLEMLSKDNDDSNLASLILELDYGARNACEVLKHMMDSYSMSAPQMRRLHIRHYSPPGTSVVDASALPQGKRKDSMTGEGQLVYCFGELHLDSDLHPPYYVLDYLDYILRTDKTTKSLLSPRLSELIAQTSIVVECMFQVWLWVQSPEVSNVRLDHESFYDETFEEWLEHLNVYDVPIHLIDPSQGKLKYPADKKQNKKNVQTMRAAEANLDQFWASIDEFFERETGIAQHEIIQECMENWRIQRTPPWKDLEVKTSKSMKSGRSFDPPPNDMPHSQDIQITGWFDKLSVTSEKVKLKTKGLAAPVLRPTVDDPAGDCKPEIERQFLLDDRSYKAIKTLFHNVTTEDHDLPKAVKWDEFKRAMVHIGFAVEKLQGSAWHFTPSLDMGANRSIQFHEPHPCNDIPYIMARRFGRRLSRAYGWSGDTFALA